ncbi:hypothetical protein V8G54_012488, partial [Vigna mungo]
MTFYGRYHLHHHHRCRGRKEKVRKKIISKSSFQNKFHVGLLYKAHSRELYAFQKVRSRSPILEISESSVTGNPKIILTDDKIIKNLGVQKEIMEVHVVKHQEPNLENKRNSDMLLLYKCSGNLVHLST